jgi:thiamine-phosphate pyrophosphorylase
MGRDWEKSSLPSLCAIVDEEVTARAGLDPVKLADSYLRAGVRWLQLRAKRAGSAVFYGWAEAIAALARQHDALFVVNDRADVARLVSAGVHVGQDDLPAAAARAIVGESALVGLSTHSADQIDRALLEPVSYIAVGPVFGTHTKDTGYDAVGVDLVRLAVQRAASRMPVVAIGGLTSDRAGAVLAAGASSLAVITDLIGSDPENRARDWVERLKSSSG